MSIKFNGAIMTQEKIHDKLNLRHCFKAKKG
jgi:hypothetical protein